jgi:hypothetical protein
VPEVVPVTLKPDAPHGSVAQAASCTRDRSSPT